MPNPSRANLLINEPPLQVLPSLAKAIGLNEAIVTQQVHYWLVNPYNAGYIDEQGNKWVFNSYPDWQDGNFPFWSIPTIQRTFASCEALGILLSAQFDKSKRNMRKYYRIDYEQLDSMDNIKLIRSTISHRHDVKGNTESTSKTTPKSQKGAGNNPLSKEDKEQLAEAKRKAKEQGPQPWRFREIFLSPAGLVELADLCVEYFGTPVKKEAWTLRETCLNMLENKVTPADLIAAKASTDTWTHKPISASGAFLTKAKALAMERINASTKHASAPAQSFPQYKDGQAIIK